MRIVAKHTALRAAFVSDICDMGLAGREAVLDELASLNKLPQLLL